MYTFFATLITFALIVLTILGARIPSAKGKKTILLVNLAISGISAVLGVILPFAAHGMIFSGGFSAEWQSWAWDALVLFLKTTLPVCGVGVLLISLTALVTNAVNGKRNLFSSVIRQSASVAISVVLLFLAPFYAAMAETEQVPIHLMILVIGICEALFMRLSFVVELGIRIRKTGEQKRKN